MRYAPAMNLNLPLTPHLQQFVREQLASGRFQTESDVVRAALRLLEDQSLPHQSSAPRLHQSSENSLTNRTPDLQEFRKQRGTDHAHHGDSTQLSASRRSPRGLLADLPSTISPDEIKEARSEMWAGLPHGEA
jgi:antitoxin ParD1/3/4